VVALTGATGFIGRRIALRVADAGWKVRALVRDPRRIGNLRDLPIEFCHGAVQDMPSLETLLQGVSAVVYCAGAVRGRHPGDFAMANIRGVANIVRLASAQSSPPRFLLISSLAARHPELSHYARSKFEGERIMKSPSAARLDWIALRPPAVYGPGEKELLPLFLWMRRGVAPLLGPPSARFSMLHVDDLVDAVVAWLRNADGVPGTYELHDGRLDGYSWNSVADIVAEVCGRRVRRLRIPAGLLELAAVGSETWARVSRGAPMLTRGKLRELRHKDWVCANDRISARLGWQPRIDLAEGLRRLFAEF
jgi:nucleoside-diphosphate-sugar epimerase